MFSSSSSIYSKIENTQSTNTSQSFIVSFTVDHLLFQLTAAKALTKDRFPIGGRPMFVSTCKENKTGPSEFKVR